jgi:hypothetical protein
VSEHQLTVYIHDIQPEALIAALDAKISPEDTGSELRYSAVDRVTLFHVWFPDEALLEKLQGISRAHPMWWVESYSRGIDWDRKWTFVGGELLYAEGSHDDSIYVSFAGEHRSCSRDAPTPGLVEWADRAHAHLIGVLGPACAVLAVEGDDIPF